jgi:hypothetical protein
MLQNTKIFIFRFRFKYIRCNKLGWLISALEWRRGCTSSMRSTLGYLLLLLTLVRHCDPPRHRFPLKNLVSTSHGREAKKHYCTWRSYQSRDEVHRGGMDDDEESDGVHVLNAPCLSRNSAIWYTLQTFFFYLVDLSFLSPLGLGKFPF